MQILLSALFTIAMIFPALADKPEIRVYHIQKMGLKSPDSTFPEVILEISNPTKETFYISASSITAPIHHLEVIRKDKWLRKPSFICGTGHKFYPLKPGIKMLVSPQTPLDEMIFRYRYFFLLKPDWDEDGFSMLSPEIKKTDLGDLKGTIGELDSTEELEKIEKTTLTNHPITLLKTSNYGQSTSTMKPIKMANKSQ